MATWRVEITSFPHAQDAHTLTRHPQADDNEFIGVVADQLFGVAAGAVRRHDPRALVLGQRFISHDAPTSVLQAAGRHFDVISVQPSIFSPESPDQVCELNVIRLAVASAAIALVHPRLSHSQ
eukprot:m.207569 g.207569  ORF g.207569 m.207569 type:complete len:123 (+) comp15445_c0_seq10:1059-1427(+)